MALLGYQEGRLMRKAKKEQRNQRVRIFDGASGIYQLWMEYAWKTSSQDLRDLTSQT